MDKDYVHIFFSYTYRICEYTWSNINNITSHDKDVFWYIQLGYIKLGLVFGQTLHLNPYVLCVINMGSVDELHVCIKCSCYVLVTNFSQVDFITVLRSENSEF